MVKWQWGRCHGMLVEDRRKGHTCRSMKRYGCVLNTYLVKLPR